MATESVELLALQRIDETCIQLQQQVRYLYIVVIFVGIENKYKVFVEIVGVTLRLRQCRK